MKKILFLFLALWFTESIFADAVDQLAFGLKDIYEEILKLEQKRQAEMFLEQELLKLENQKLKTVWNKDTYKKYKDDYERNYSDIFQKIDYSNFQKFFNDLKNALKPDEDEFKPTVIEKIFKQLKNIPWYYFSVKDYLYSQLDEKNQLQKKLKNASAKKIELLIENLKRLFNKISYDDDKGSDKGKMVIESLTKYLDYIVGEKQYDVIISQKFLTILKEKNMDEFLSEMESFDQFIEKNTKQKGLLDKTLDNIENKEYKDKWADYIIDYELKIPYYQDYASIIESSDEYFNKFFTDFKDALNNNKKEELSKKLKNNIEYYTGIDNYILYQLNKQNELNFVKFLKSDDGKDLFEALQKLIEGKINEFENIIKVLKDKKAIEYILNKNIKNEDQKNFNIKRNAVIETIINAKNINDLLNQLKNDDLYITPLKVIESSKDQNKVIDAFNKLIPNLNETNIKDFVSLLLSTKDPWKTLREKLASNSIKGEPVFIYNLNNDVIERILTDKEKNKSVKINDFSRKMSIQGDNDVLYKQYLKNWPYKE